MPPIKSELVSREHFGTLDTTQINRQIELRREMMRQMVGSLYPSILSDEIDKLTFLRALLTEKPLITYIRYAKEKP